MRDIAPLSRGAVSRFWSKVDVLSDDECWLWKASVDREGYGIFGYNGKSYQRLAHRVAYSMSHGDINTHECIRHLCGTPACVNPRHLVGGSMQENMADRDRHGKTATGNRNGRATMPYRTARGDANGKSKLTNVLVFKLRERAASGESVASLSREVGIEYAWLHKVIRGHAWFHVPMPDGVQVGEKRE